jgi:SAM-dependent MidA family methyltransferase
MKEMKEKGPMSFNKFMEHCLLHSEHGYYMKRDVFNAKGDFITSPEISQMFGEMFGLWIAMFLDKIGKLQAMKSH